MAERSNRVRSAIRAAHAAVPEAAAVIEAYLDMVEARCVALSAEDPYRALVLDLHETMVRVDSGVLADVARVEVGRLELARAQAVRDTAVATDRAEARSIWKTLLTPQALAILIPLLFGSGSIGGIIAKHYFPVEVQQAQEATP